MPASDLMVDKITEIKSTLAEAKSKGITLNEAQTEAIIIDPLLMALGYGPLEFQKREYDAVASNFPDYTLLPETAHKWFLEVKKLDLPLKDGEASQAVNYANNQGAAWAVLTNGRTWYFYNAHAPVPLTEKRVFQIDDLFNDPGAVSLLAMLAQKSMIVEGLTQAWVASRVADVVRQQLQTPNSATRKAIKKAVSEELKTQIADISIGNAIDEILHPLKIVEQTPSAPVIAVLANPLNQNTNPTNLKPSNLIKSSSVGDLKTLEYFLSHPALVTRSKPTEIKLLDNNLRAINTWRDLVQETVLMIATKFGLPTLPVAANETGKRYFLNSDPIHGNGKDMVTPTLLEIGTTKVYIEMNQDALGKIRVLLLLLKSVSAPLDAVRLKTAASKSDLE